EFALARVRVVREAIAASLRRHADHEVLALATREVVLTDDEIAPGRPDDVVRSIQKRRVRGLHYQRQTLLPQADAENLAELPRAAVGATEVNAAVRVCDPFRARELRAPVRETLCAGGAWSGLRLQGFSQRVLEVRVGIGILDAHPLDRQRIAEEDRVRDLPILREQPGPFAHAQRLEHAALCVISHAQSRWLLAATQH